MAIPHGVIKVRTSCASSGAASDVCVCVCGWLSQKAPAAFVHRCEYSRDVSVTLGERKFKRKLRVAKLARSKLRTSRRRKKSPAVSPTKHQTPFGSLYAYWSPLPARDRSRSELPSRVPFLGFSAFCLFVCLFVTKERKVPLPVVVHSAGPAQMANEAASGATMPRSPPPPSPRASTTCSHSAAASSFCTPRRAGHTRSKRRAIR
jgi:hypothetical protein